MTDERKGIVCILGIMLLAMLAYAIANTDDTPITPEVEGEIQFSGARNGAAYGAGTVLDLRPEVHFWAPGYNPRDTIANCSNVASCTGNGGCGSCPVKLRHRYPTGMGVNVASMMHGSWQDYANNSPDKDWMYLPPEAAVL